MTDMNEIVDNLIDTYLTRPEKVRVPGRFYASEMGMCPRKLYFIHINPKKIDDRLRRIFAVGNIYHDWIEKMFKETEGVKLLHSERSVTLISPVSEVIIAGRLDDYILIERTGETVLIEVKSIKSFAYLKEPKKEHVVQINLYMKALGLKQGCLLYVKKDDLEIKTFVVDYNPELAREMVNKAEYIQHSINTNTPPQKCEDKDSWQCKWCAYNLECAEATKQEELK